MKKKERKSAGPRFLLNRSGVPLSEEAWDRMFIFYAKNDKQLRYSNDFIGGTALELLLEIEDKAKYNKTRYPSLPKLSALGE